MRRLVIIPAKKVSARLKRKNFVLINNKRMFEYTLSNVLNSKLFETIHISSNIKINKKFQKFLRPNSLCKKNTSLNKVIYWTLQKYKKEGKIFDTVCLAYATAPLLEPDDFKKACKKFEKKNNKFPLLSVSKYNPSLDEAMIFDKNCIRPKNKKKFFQDSKKHREYYFDTGSFIFFHCKFFYKKNFSLIKLNNYFKPFILPREKSIDINTKDDLNFVKYLIKKK